MAGTRTKPAEVSWALPLSADAVPAADSFDQLADPAPAPPGAAGAPRRGRRFTMASQPAAVVRTMWDGWVAVLPGSGGEPDTAVLVADPAVAEWWHGTARRVTRTPPPTVAGAPVLVAWSGVDAAAVGEALAGRVVAAAVAKFFPPPAARKQDNPVLDQTRDGTGKTLAQLLQARTDRPAASSPDGAAWCRARFAELLPTLRVPAGPYRLPGAVWLPAGTEFGRCAADGGRWWTELLTFDPVGVPVDPLHYLHVLNRAAPAQARDPRLTAAQRQAWGLDGARPEPLRVDAGVIRLPSAGGTARLRRDIPALRLLTGPTPLPATKPPRTLPYPQATHWRVDEEASVVGLMSRTPGGPEPADPSDWVSWPARVGDWPLLVRDVWAAHGAAIAAVAQELLLPCEVALAYCAQWAGASHPDTTGRLGARAERVITVAPAGAPPALRSACQIRITGGDVAENPPGSGSWERRLTADRQALVRGSARYPATVVTAAGSNVRVAASGTFDGRVLVAPAPSPSQRAVAAPLPTTPQPAGTVWYLPFPDRPGSTAVASNVDNRRVVVGGGQRVRRLRVTVAPGSPLGPAPTPLTVQLLVDGVPTGPELRTAPPPPLVPVLTASTDIVLGAASALSIRITAADPIDPPANLTVSAQVDDLPALAGGTLVVTAPVSVRLPAGALDPATRLLPAADLTVRELADQLAVPGGPAAVSVGLCQTTLSDVPAAAAWLAARRPGGAGYSAPGTNDEWLARLGELFTAEHAARLGLVAARRALFENPAGFDPWRVPSLADAMTAAFALFERLPAGMAAPTVRWQLPPVAPAPPPAADAAALEQLAGQQPLTQAVLDAERARLALPAHDYRRVHLAQKRLHLARLRNRYGFAPGPAFEYGSTDLRNLAKLEAVAEFFLNYRDPRFTGAAVLGYTAPLSEGDAGYVRVDLFGPAGSGATGGPGNRVTLTGYTADQADALGSVLVRDGSHHRDLLEVGGQRLAITAVVDVKSTKCVVEVAPALTAAVSGPWRVRRHPQLVLVDPFGPAEGFCGADGTVGTVEDFPVSQLSFPLAGRPGLSDLYVGMDTVRLPADTATHAPAASYRVVVGDPLRAAPPAKKGGAAPAAPTDGYLAVDGVPDAGTGLAWYAPAGVGGFLPPLHGTQGPGQPTSNQLVDYRGALFLVAGGEVYGPWRWTSFTFEGNTPEHLLSARGNRAYEITGVVSGAGGGSYRNYCLGVADPVPAGFLASDRIAESRFHWTGVGRDADRRAARTAEESVRPGRKIGTIRLHDGHSGNTGSWGCFVSPDYCALRRTFIDRYRAELDDLSAAERDLFDVLAGCDRDGSVTQHQVATPPGDTVPPAAHRDLWTAAPAATLYLVRPEERPTPSLITSVSPRYGLSRATGASVTVTLAVAGAAFTGVFLEGRPIAGATVTATSATVAITAQDVRQAGVVAGTQGRLGVGAGPERLAASTDIWVQT